VPGLADMIDETDPFVFPDMPDEAVVAIDQFLEAFYLRFRNIPSPKCTAGITHSISESITTPCRLGRSPIHRSDNPTMTAAPTPRSLSPMAHHRS
jgi:hypothetical protein